VRRRIFCKVLRLNLSILTILIFNTMSMNKYILYIAFMCLLSSFLGCSTDDAIKAYEEEKNILDKDSIELNVMANKWILRAMKLYYYWADDIPQDMESKYSICPQEFYSILLHRKDRFSWISTDKASNDEEIYGSSTNRGFECVFFYADSAQFDLVAEVIYTSPGSQAETDGIKRGMFIKEINGERLNVSNYKELLAAEKACYQFISVDDDIIETRYITVTREAIPQNPILASKMLQYKDHNIGYVCYRQFLNDNGDGSERYKNELVKLFAYFREQRASDIVLDLRYNTGGDINLSVLLGSMLVPEIGIKQEALKIKYNEKLTNAYLSMGYELSLNFMFNEEGYIGNMVNNIIILTGHNTASASEDLINMLLPYKKIVLIGTKTYGKNYGSQVIYSSNKDIKWVLQPITMKIFNSENLSDFDNGFLPDYEIDETSFLMKEFGTIDEPLMSKALEIITNNNEGEVARNRTDKNIYKNNLKRWKYSINVDELYSLKNKFIY